MPGAVEAKEFLRAKTIGKQVLVTLEYEREMPATGALPALRRQFGNVSIRKSNKNTAEVNVSELLVADGLVEVVKHRQDDEKAANYDELLEAESVAQVAKRGLYSTKARAADVRLTDLSIDGAKAKQYLPFLKREKTLKAMVEFVYSGSRVKLSVAKENCQLNFSFAGIKCPQTERKNVRGEAFGDEAKAYVREHLMQRQVQVEIEDMDRGGTAFGSLFVNGKLFALALLTAGLAYVDEYSVERTRMGDALYPAEAEAKARRKGLWASIENKTRVTNVQDVPKTSDATIPVKVCDIVSGGHFFVQDQTTKAVFATVEAKMAQLLKEVGTSGSLVDVKRGTVVAALFGNAWCRAKVGIVQCTIVKSNIYIETKTLSVSRPKDMPLERVCWYDI